MCAHFLGYGNAALMAWGSTDGVVPVKVDPRHNGHVDCMVLVSIGF